MKISTTGKSVQTHGHREYDGIHHKEDAEREKRRTNTEDTSMISARTVDKAGIFMVIRKKNGQQKAVFELPRRRQQVNKS